MGWSGGVVASYPFLSQAPTPVEVELGCDNILLLTVTLMQGAVPNDEHIYNICDFQGHLCFLK